jgi:ribosomal protein S18 acetylase RimI-like enzyme
MTDLKLIDVSHEYYEFIRELRFHPDNISGFINQETITEDQQISYMEKFSNCYKVCLLNNEPVGFVGVIEDDIRVAVKPEYKKMGIGKFMIENIISQYPNSYAKIKIDNTSSIKLFESCGFNIKFLIMSK